MGNEQTNTKTARRARTQYTAKPTCNLSIPFEAVATKINVIGQYENVAYRCLSNGKRQMKTYHHVFTTSLGQLIARYIKTKISMVQ